MTADNQHDAFRAAGQVVAALAEGMPIESVSPSGIALAGSDSPRGHIRRRDALAEIAIGLAGIAAEGRYSFGTPPAEPDGRASVCVEWSFSARQLADFAIVRELIATIDPHDDQDILLQAWMQALSFVADDANWEAIESFVDLIAEGTLHAAEIYHLPSEHPFGPEGFIAGHRHGESADWIG